VWLRDRDRVLDLDLNPLSTGPQHEKIRLPVTREHIVIKILNIVGARPNFMKIAPIMRAMADDTRFQPVLVHTGQHYDENLSRVFFDDLGIPQPDLNLGVGSGSREEQIAKVSEAFAPVVDQQQPTAVLVVGDVNSTIACARVAREKKCPVIHVEAGLRSFDDTMPEEINRVATDKISDFLFVTEESGMLNLQRESVPGERFLVGNVMIDTLIHNLERARRSGVLNDLKLRSNEYMVATFHRPSNVDTVDALARLLKLLRGVCAQLPLVLPLHPRTRASLQQHGLLDELKTIPRLHVVEPLGYLDFLALVSHSSGVVTDSGGIQEETTYLQIPCLTMRTNTERPVTIDIGSNELIGEDLDRLLSAISEVRAGTFKRGAIPQLWDGLAAERIVKQLGSSLAS
jgi:UDP-N-acetylglucosamine 2-epimerase (non-hydrolysing)